MNIVLNKRFSPRQHSRLFQNGGSLDFRCDVLCQKYILLSSRKWTFWPRQGSPASWLTLTSLLRVEISTPLDGAVFEKISTKARKDDVTFSDVNATKMNLQANTYNTYKSQTAFVVVCLFWSVDCNFDGKRCIWAAGSQQLIRIHKKSNKGWLHGEEQSWIVILSWIISPVASKNCNNSYRDL